MDSGKATRSSSASGSIRIGCEHYGGRPRRNEAVMVYRDWVDRLRLGQPKGKSRSEMSDTPQMLALMPRLLSPGSSLVFDNGETLSVIKEG